MRGSGALAAVAVALVMPVRLHAIGLPTDDGTFAEEDENGVVWLRRADGSPLMFMARSVFDALAATRSKQSAHRSGAL